MTSNELMRPCPWKTGWLVTYAIKHTSIAEMLRYIPLEELQKRICLDAPRLDTRYKLQTLEHVEKPGVWTQIQHWISPSLSPITYGNFAVISDIPPNGGVCILEQYNESLPSGGTVQGFVINIKDTTDLFWYSLLFLSKTHRHPLTLLESYPKYSKIFYMNFSMKKIFYLLVDGLLQIWWDSTLIALVDFRKKFVLLSKLTYEIAMPVFFAQEDYYIGFHPYWAYAPAEDLYVKYYLISYDDIDTECH